MSSEGSISTVADNHNRLHMTTNALSTSTDALTGSPSTLGPDIANSAPASTAERPSFRDGLKYGAAGGVAGAFAKSCTAPLARLTILYQVQGFNSGAAGQQGAVQQPPRLRHAFMQVVKREGPAALWKGNLATILHRLPYSSINFYTYEHTNKFLRQQMPSNAHFARSLTSGALAGLVACTAAYPLDLVRTRLAAQTQGNYYHGIFPTMRRIVADEGAVGLYRGLGATLLQVVPSLALSFSLYDTIRDSCMTVYYKQQLRQQRHSGQQVLQQQQHALESAAAQSSEQVAQSSANDSKKRRRSLLSTPSNPQELAHSWSVASSVDQGTSLAQAAIWHMADQDAQAASSSGPQKVSSEADAAAAAAQGVSSGGWGHDSSSSTSSVEACSSSGRSQKEVPAGISLVSGCVSGFITATVTFPLDVIRRRMQVYGREHHAEPVSYRQIIQQISHHRGFRGFYVGILPEYCKVVPGVAIAFCTYEHLKKWLQAQ